MEYFFDIDGVILDFEHGFMDYLRCHYKPDLPEGYRPKTWEMDTEFKDVDIGIAWEKFILSPEFTRLKCLVSISTFNKISEHYPVHLVTNLPLYAKDARESNLRFHGLEFQSLNLGGHCDFGVKGYPRKDAVIREIHSPNKQLIFVDDHPINCEDVQNAFPEAKVYLLTRPHNEARKDLPFPRINTLEELLHRE